MTFAESVTFVLTLSFLDCWQIILGLLIGGAIAAPMAAILTKKLPVKTLMFIGGDTYHRVEHPYDNAGAIINILVRTLPNPRQQPIARLVCVLLVTGEIHFAGCGLPDWCG